MQINWFTSIGFVILWISGILISGSMAFNQASPADASLQPDSLNDPSLLSLNESNNNNNEENTVMNELNSSSQQLPPLETSASQFKMGEGIDSNSESNQTESFLDKSSSIWKRIYYSVNIDTFSALRQDSNVRHDILIRSMVVALCVLLSILIICLGVQYLLSKSKRCKLILNNVERSEALSRNREVVSYLAT
eukprot:TRINITY_DN7233_c0_g2_i1.p1 TRINITY_DN7233_c0_g2~~TRINITY_DN7233_c0_g2_i1.p1  ORF type:complete len:193 (-),score=8.57 TRINITY_DN7233_c0_g2_i1:81-659(-)